MNYSSLYEASSEDSTNYINKKTNKIKRIILLSLKTVIVKTIVCLVSKLLLALTHKQSSSNDLLGGYGMPLNGYLTPICGDPRVEAQLSQLYHWAMADKAII